MVFTSYTFLFIFLPLFLLCYYLSGPRPRNLIALLFSYFFYGWGAPNVILILLLSSISDYYLSRIGERSRKQRRFFVLSVLINVGLLIYYKYTNFALGELNSVVQWFGFRISTLLSIQLGQIIEIDRRLGMVSPVGLIVDDQRPFVQCLSFCVPPQVVVQ